jgi:PmbA protein
MADLTELARKTVDMVMKLGPSDCDVVVSDARFVSAEIEGGSMKQSSAASDPGVGIRVFAKGGSGYSYCTGLDPAVVKEVARAAVAQARAGTEDPDFKGLPEKEKVRKVDGMYDPRIATLRADDIVQAAIELADIAGDDKRITSVNASVGVGVGQVVLTNSNGIVASEKMSGFELSAEAVSKSGDHMFSGVDGAWSRKFEPKMSEGVGKNAREHAVMGLKTTKIETGDLPVILDPLAAGFVLGMAIGGGVNAESIQRKRSYLVDKLGSKIGSEKFSVTDDPTLKWASGSYSFDGEGVPGRRSHIIDKGVLEMFMHDSYTAGKEGKKSTGHSSRGGPVWTYRRPPAISPSNLVVESGDSSLDEMLAETKEGVYLRLTYDYPNLVTGEFSSLMMESYRIIKGELGPSIRQATMGTHLVDMYKNVDMVGKDSRYAFGVKTPAIRISKARIGGST